MQVLIYLRNKLHLIKYGFLIKKIENASCTSLQRISQPSKIIIFVNRNAFSPKRLKPFAVHIAAYAFAVGLSGAWLCPPLVTQPRVWGEGLFGFTDPAGSCCALEMGVICSCQAHGLSISMGEEVMVVW